MVRREGFPELRQQAALPTEDLRAAGGASTARCAHAAHDELLLVRAVAEAAECAGGNRVSDHRGDQARGVRVPRGADEGVRREDAADRREGAAAAGVRGRREESYGGAAGDEAAISISYRLSAKGDRA